MRHCFLFLGSVFLMLPLLSLRTTLPPSTYFMKEVFVKAVLETDKKCKIGGVIVQFDQTPFEWVYKALGTYEDEQLTNAFEELKYWNPFPGYNFPEFGFTIHTYYSRDSTRFGEEVIGWVDFL